MKKYLDYIKLLPIALLTMFFIKDSDVHNHTKKVCIGYAFSLTIFILLYILLCMNICKWVSLLIVIICWIFMMIIRQKLNT